MISQTNQQQQEDAPSPNEKLAKLLKDVLDQQSALRAASGLEVEDSDCVFHQLADMLLESPANKNDRDGIKQENTDIHFRNEKYKTSRECECGSDWDEEALRELAETGAVSSVLEQNNYSGSGASSVPKDSGDLQSTIIEAAEAGNNSSSFGKFMLYTPLSGTCQSQDTFKEVLAAMQDMNDMFWLDISDPTAEDMEKLAREFDIHPLTVEDILTDAGDQDKLESIGDYTLLMYRTTADEEDNMEFSIIVKHRCVLSFHSSKASSHVQNTLDRLYQLRSADAVTKQQAGSSRALASSPYIVYVLVDDITDSLGLVMRRIELEVDKLDELTVLQRIGLLRRRILSFWRLLLGKPDVVRALTRLLVQMVCAAELNTDDNESSKCDSTASGLGFLSFASPEDVNHYLSDICDHLAALASACGHCEMVLARAHANYMARLSLEVSSADVGVSVFSNRWIVLAGMLLPLQIVTMLFGQNIKVPWKYHEGESRFNNLNAWFGIFGCLLGAFVCVVCFVRFMKVI
ncbi:hypothetical protein BX070DRAFT_230338 [Coemansia spiralis]|nr:hypothetical protein BX070DRAFT_230338 [Coemansia spiralis]